MKNGFTLVELSIVLVIIGLLIGGILVGQSLIDSARIQAQIRQFQQYDIALSNFKSQYNQIPGDCSFCNHNATTNVDTYENNGVLNDLNGNVAPSFLRAEAQFFFIDLSEVGMINEDYQWSAWVSAGEGEPFPEAAIGRGALLVSGTRDGSIFYTYRYGQDRIGSSTFSVSLAEGNISPLEAVALDSKLDDGLPSSGDIASVTATPWVSSITRAYPFVIETTNATCINTGSPNSYNTASDDTSLCRMVFKSQGLK